METIYTDSNRRHDFVLVFDITDGNPNGDPDAGNLPRVDPETMQGLVTDVCLKRKVRNWVDVTRGEQEHFKIYVQNRGIALNTLHQRAYDRLGLKSTGSKQKREDVDRARDEMCRNFYDIRTFGAVMTTGVNCGQVRGPVQMTFARSVDPIVPLDISITRVAVTRAEDAEVIEGEEKEGGKVTEMGRKAIVPYALYVGYGFISAQFAKQTGFSQEDLAVFWEALQGMWDLDHSSSRGLMACRGLYVFTHMNGLGNAPSHTLFERISIQRNNGVESPRKFADYLVTVDDQNFPEGIMLTCLVDSTNGRRPMA
jgi:CRISPR-associated protein Csd2